MQTNIQKPILQRSFGQEANDILRSCVHCGFCAATCPTYQLLGDELDSPRGRIYLIKNLLETGEASKKTQTHLDRCLSCGACETTCPSGVKYRRLLDIGKEVIEEKIARGVIEKFKKKTLSYILNSKKTFSFLLCAAQRFSVLVPEKIKNRIPKRQETQQLTPTINSQHKRKMILFRGCVHDALAPEINASAIRVLDKLGISVIEVDELRCCGSIDHHLQEKDRTAFTIKQNIDTLLSKMTPHVEAIFTTASACSLMLKDYPTFMADNNEYHNKAMKLADKFKDISEIICSESLGKLDNFNIKPEQYNLSFHSPCSLQHGLKITDKIEVILESVGFKLAKITDSHLCCGSAGTYSILQPTISKQLLKNKIHHLTAERTDIIATANIGCLVHLQSESTIPVKHWITLLDRQLQ